MPALIRKVREWIGADLSDKSARKSQTASTGSQGSQPDSTYKPVTERNLS